MYVDIIISHVFNLNKTFSFLSFRMTRNVESLDRVCMLRDKML